MHSVANQMRLRVTAKTEQFMITQELRTKYKPFAANRQSALPKSTWMFWLESEIIKCLHFVHIYRTKSAELIRSSQQMVMTWPSRQVWRKNTCSPMRWDIRSRAFQILMQVASMTHATIRLLLINQCWQIIIQSSFICKCRQRSRWMCTSMQELLEWMLPSQ